MIDSLLNDDLLKLNKFTFHSKLFSLNPLLFNKEVLDFYQLYNSGYPSR